MIGTPKINIKRPELTLKKVDDTELIFCSFANQKSSSHPLNNKKCKFLRFSNQNTTSLTRHRQKAV